MAEAIKLAKAAKAKGNFPFGAVIVRDGQVIAKGECEEVTLHNVTKHAELLAVDEACEASGTVDLSDCVIYASAEPCNMCASAIFQADIPRVVIGATRSDLSNFFRNRKIGIKELAADSSHKIEVTTGVMKAEAAELFEDVNRA